MNWWIVVRPAKISGSSLIRESGEHVDSTHIGISGHFIVSNSMCMENFHSYNFIGLEHNKNSCEILIKTLSVICVVSWSEESVGIIILTQLPSLAGVHSPHTRPGGHQVLGGQPGQDGHPRPGVCSALHLRRHLSRTPPVRGARTLPPHPSSLPRSLCRRHGGKVGTKWPRQRVSGLLANGWLQKQRHHSRFVRFSHYAIPRESLLNRTADVTPEGEYVTPFKVPRPNTPLSLLLSPSTCSSPPLSISLPLCHSLSLFLSQDPSKRFGALLGVLSSGRVGITELCVTNLRLAVCIAIR